MLTIRALADELAIDPGDVAVLAESLLEAVSDELPDEVADELRLQLSPNGERTELHRYWSVTP